MSGAFKWISTAQQGEGETSSGPIKLDAAQQETLLY